ncbi:hypothetical protein [Sinorhizobium meliloti]|uniref:hypothetical protein n=1 Tax=Rhizobium meliloti TaxID=382 RepID=UPI000FD7CC05|nr:hypothetical protein [Sinorhizobium meliloti]QGJ73789.1 hypothetical protein C3L21_07055 [Sinorhizobium meliloti]RVG89050.1 hypothetical protein CN218_26225 [Sinorhizobium meliloti]RVK89654.1 hypothetical protein CN150_30195 [Sinorhizobium meliloti]RVL60747.1 hypothetical protein CN137_18295 [Sinorhizobium meliloti]
MSITRRSILGGIATAATPLPAIAAITPVLSPEERLQAAIEELKEAASLAMPRVQRWQVCLDTARDGCPFIVAAYTF